ncbi:hypothetical protein [Mesonia sp. K7]|uniref:TlpA family protein disulfide reductase n=1 Tax=Mesonia sp. K7 TaxID=2218606 RepID=UPI000DA7B77F|nr:hypothetical protein [Mesonia sp. K7]PZD79589.1 hypothetical protein DNG35_00855 [Mesonia sp. K7]
MKQCYLLIISLFILVSCKKDVDEDVTFFAGKILNTNHKYITIGHKSGIIDTVYLNDNSEFSYTFKNAEPGFYKFRLEPESQMFYIEEGDSLWVRVNASEFDESLVFTGDGAERNNFLMQLYLLNEKNNDLILSYYKLSPSEFAKINDSIRGARLSQLNELNTTHNFSPEFFNTAKKTIDYEYYDFKERYSFLMNRYFNEFNIQYPDNFFDYREEVDFNDKDLEMHYTYEHFMDNYIKNKSLENCLKKHKASYCVSLNSAENLKGRIILADSLFKNEDVRNRYITRYVSSGIIFSENKSQLDSSLETIKELNYTNDLIVPLEEMVALQRLFLSGSNISDKTLYNSKLETITIKEKLHKPTVVFFWSMYQQEQLKNTHLIINELRNKYPEIDFIGLNIDIGEKEAWQKALENLGYNQDYEYQIAKTDFSKKLYHHYLHKILFVNKNGEIIRGNATILNPNFENYILEFLNN